jgi:mannitol 2-dehydrogenase
LVRDVAPYEAMKLRCANCTHQAICYFGTLLGYRYGHEALQDQRILKLVRRYLSEEALPSLTPIEGVDFAAYAAQVVERFTNPEIADTLARIRAFGSDRIPKWLLPVVRDNLAAGRSVRMSAAICASWARYNEGLDERGEPIEIVDRLQEQLARAAQAQQEHPTAFIENRELFGDLVDNPAAAAWIGLPLDVQDVLVQVDIGGHQARCLADTQRRRGEQGHDIAPALTTASLNDGRRQLL